MRWRSTADKKKAEVPEPIQPPGSVVDPAFYLREYPDIAATGADPARHFFEHGMTEGRFASAKDRRRSSVFDPAWYGAQRFPHHVPSRFRVGVTAGWNRLELLADYAEIGEALGLTPHPLFDPAWYLRQLGARPTTGTALQHYIDIGHSLSPHPLFDPTSPAARAAPHGVNPLNHYLTTREVWRLSPNRYFDGEFYLRTYRDVREGTMAPLMHYAMHGPSEGREVSATFWPEDPHGPAAPRGLVLEQVMRERLESRWLDHEGIAFPAVSHPDVSVIIATHGGWPQTRDCLRALARTVGDGVSCEVLVVDAGTDDGTIGHLERIPGIRVIRHASPLNYAEACNSGFWQSRGRLIALLSSEILVDPEWLPALADTFDDPTVGMAGSMILLPDGRLAEAGWIIYRDRLAHRYGRWRDPNDFRYGYPRNADLANLGAVMARRELLEATSGLDEWIATTPEDQGHLAMTIRLRGGRTVYQPRARAVHDLSIEASPADRARSSSGLGLSWQYGDRRLREALARQPAPGPDSIERAVREVAGGTVMVASSEVPRPGEGDGESPRVTAVIREIQARGYPVVFIPADGDDGGRAGQALRDGGVAVVWRTDEWAGYLGLLRDTARAVVICGLAAAGRVGPLLAETQPAAPMVFDAAASDLLEPDLLEPDAPGPNAAGPESMKPEREARVHGASSRAAAWVSDMEAAAARAATTVWVASGRERDMLAARVPGARIEIVPVVPDHGSRECPLGGVLDDAASPLRPTALGEAVDRLLLPRPTDQVTG
ncbi:MAG: glycosyltransferase [Bifidobacteriaceae bacterium]|jgi:GT2 family glycosyltransferase|nr:glycosyltransferase [Bifidobacteriaceae bacterium]